MTMKQLYIILEQTMRNAMFISSDIFVKIQKKLEIVVRQINRCPKLQIKTDFLEPAIA